MAIPGLYIPIRGDYSDFQKDMARLAGIARQQGEDIANALNQAISPQDAVKGLKAIGSALKQLTAAAQSTGKTLNAPIQELDEFAARANVARSVVEELHHAMVRTARDRQIENNLRALQRQCGLTASAMARLRAEMGDAAGSMNNAMQGLGIRPLRAIQDEIKEVEAQYQHMLEMFRSGHATENDVARAFAARGQRMEALQREAGTWQDPARASALRQRYDTLVAQAGRGRTSFAQFEARNTARDAVNAFQELNGRLPRPAEIRQIAQACGASAAQIRRMRDELDHSSNAFKALIGYAQVWVTFGFVHTAQDFVKTAMALENVEVAFKAIYGTTDMAQKKLEFVRQVSDELGLSFLDTAEGAKKLFAAAQGTPIEAEANMVFKAFSNMSAAMKLTGDETKGVFLAVSQMISKGKVSAEELRQQLAERMPGAVNLFASSIGVSTQELDKMLQAGGVTLEHFLTFARAVNERYAAGAAQASHTLQAELARIGNTWANFQKDMTDTGKLAGWARSFNDVFKGVTSAIAKISDEIGTLMHMALAAWIASSLTPGGKLNAIVGSLATSFSLAKKQMVGFRAASIATAEGMTKLGKAAAVLMKNPLIAGLATGAAVFGIEKLFESTEDKNAFKDSGKELEERLASRMRSEAADKNSRFTPEKIRSSLGTDTKDALAEAGRGVDALSISLNEVMAKRRDALESADRTPFASWFTDIDKERESLGVLGQAYDGALSKLREYQEQMKKGYDSKTVEPFLAVQDDIAANWGKIRDKLIAAGATEEVVQKFRDAFNAIDAAAGRGFDNISKYLSTFTADSTSAAKQLGLEMDKATSKMFDKLDKASQGSAIGKAAKELENFQKVAKMLGDVPLAQTFDANVAACGKFADEISGLITRVGNAEQKHVEYVSSLEAMKNSSTENSQALNMMEKAQAQVDAQTQELASWQDKLATAIFQTASAAGGTDAQFNVMTAALKAAQEAGIITVETLNAVLDKVNEIRGAAAAAVAAARGAAIIDSATKKLTDTQLRIEYKKGNKRNYIELRKFQDGAQAAGDDAYGQEYDLLKYNDKLGEALKGGKGGKKGGGSKRVDNTAEKYQSSLEGFRKEIAKLRGETDKVTLDKKFADMDKQLKGSTADIKALKKEYFEAFNANKVQEVRKEIMQLTGNDKGLAELEIAEKMKAFHAEIDGVREAAKQLGVEAPEDLTKLGEAYEKALRANEQEQYLQKLIPVYQEVAVYEKDKAKLLEMQNKLIDIQAEKMATTLPPDIVKQWKELQKLAVSDNPIDGIILGLRKYGSEAGALAKTMSSAVEQAFDGMADAFVQFATTGKFSFKDMANSIIADLMRITVKSMILGPIANAIGGALGSLFNLGGGSGVSGSVSMGGNAGISSGVEVHGLGDVFTGLHGYSNQIVSRPTLFSYGSQLTRFAKGGVMGEAGPEAVMPLTRMGNGRLGVQAAGGDAMSLSLTIVDKTQGGIGVEDTQASQNGIKIDLLVQQLDSKLAGLAASGKSRFVGAMEKTHRMPSKRGWN